MKPVEGEKFGVAMLVGGGARLTARRVVVFTADGLADADAALRGADETGMDAMTRLAAGIGRCDAESLHYCNNILPKTFRSPDGVW